MTISKKSKLTTDIQRLVDYLWEDEERDYEASLKGDKADHIYACLRQLRWWLNRQAASRNEHVSFGHCPRCGGNDGGFSIHGEHYFYCRLCRTIWRGETNLMSSWRIETDEHGERNKEAFAGFVEVTPVYDWRATYWSRAMLDRWRQQKRVAILIGLLAFTTVLFLPELLTFAGMNLPRFGHYGGMEVPEGVPAGVSSVASSKRFGAID